MTSRTGTILDQIVERTSADLATRRKNAPLDRLASQIAEMGDAAPFAGPLRTGNPGLIAEFKRASPSKGLIAGGLDPLDVATDYINGGATAISVLTDGPFFQGSLDDLARVSAVAHEAAPVRAALRKDFMVDPYQIAEARASGADAVLLIVAILKGAELREMLDKVRSYGLEALVEVHDEAELAEALDAGAEVIGINNRDLRTFDVDLTTTERLAPLVPKDRTIVAESGIFTQDDVCRLCDAGAHAILVGESLMMASDRQSAVRDLLRRT